MSLIDINFSNGIRSEDIQSNFENIEKQIQKERLSIAGHGIANGLEFSIDEFKLTISAGGLIDIDGKEVSIHETIINIPYPRLLQAKEAIYTVQSDGKIVLPSIPYSTYRKGAAQNDIQANYGIKIVDYSNSSKTLPVMSISNNIITTDARWSGQLVKITYQYTNKRYDTLYIDSNNQIKIMEGITSSSSSVSMPDSSQYKYILGIVGVEPYSVNQYGEMVAKISIEKDMKSLRNVYTDSKNNLYLAGVQFDDLQIINMVEPKAPYENQLWYDDKSNKLRVWKTIDGISEWQNVNDTSIIPVREFKLWTPDKNPTGNQVFIFHMTDDMNMRFVPNRNELEVYIDNGPLHSDQFEELTTEDALSDPVLKQLLITQYGYTDEWISKTNTEFDNIGIGFKLSAPLDKACYVEVRATHRVNDNSTRVRFQRSATFVESESFYYNSEYGKVITTKAPYKVSENQLEVFIDGRRLNTTLHFIEGIDLDISDRIKGATSSQFQINTDIPENAIISYKVTTNIYSYDNIDLLVGDLGNRIVSAEDAINTKSTEIEQFIVSTNANMNVLQNKISVIEENEEEHATFLKNTDKLDSSNMSENFNARIPKGIINRELVKTSDVIPSPDVYPEDFVMLIHMKATEGNHILIRGIDYDITIDDISGSPYVTFINTQTVPDGDTLYLTGIKFREEEVRA